MLSALFGSPRYLLQKESQAEQVAAEQRVAQARRRSIQISHARSRSSSNEAAADAKSPAARMLQHNNQAAPDALSPASIRPTMRERRASLGFEPDPMMMKFDSYSNGTANTAGDEIPAGALADEVDQALLASSTRHKRSSSFPTAAVLPYTLQSSSDKENELPISDAMVSGAHSARPCIAMA